MGTLIITIFASGILSFIMCIFIDIGVIAGMMFLICLASLWAVWIFIEVVIWEFRIEMPKS